MEFDWKVFVKLMLWQTLFIYLFMYLFIYFLERGGVGGGVVTFWKFKYPGSFFFMKAPAPYNLKCS